jgi:glycosyltransferase involved in cell wall biosynthesis
MHVTVAICTWNRAPLLHQTLEHLRGLEIPGDVDWQVLVVNNNCTDDTDKVLACHERQLPLRRLFEPTPGKSHALNSAIDWLDTELILWTDDDVLAAPNWLSSYVATARQYPEASFFGGPIDAWFEHHPPAWLTESWSRVVAAYALRECNDRSCEVREDYLPFGANFGVRLAAQRKYPYDTQLGRVGEGQVRGEETDVIQRMMADGHRGVWSPEARVRHFIPGSRLTESYLRGFYYGIGRTHAVVEGNGAATDMPVGWRRAGRWSKAVFAEARFQVTRRVCRPARWVKDLSRCGYYWGRAA